MAKFPTLSCRKVIKAFQVLGWEVVRQTGSHVIMTQEGQLVTLSIPNHNPVAKGTLRSLLRAAGVTPQQFLEALQSK